MTHDANRGADPKPSSLTASAAAALIASGRLTSESLVRSLLDRIEEREGVVGAWQHLDPDLALAQARVADGKRPDERGPLHGLPIGVKDLMDTADMPTRYGSPIYDGHQPRADAACVTLARAAGAIVLGKTVTTEFAYFHPGKTTNPVDPRHTPGGSSSGSAAAVGAGMVPLAFGTQTAGSVIRPAAYCGVVGFKPSFGLIPRAGIKSLSETLDTVGVFARNVGDAALFAAAITGRPDLQPRDGNEAPARFGLVRPPYPATPQAETLEALETGASIARESGATLREIETPSDLAALPEQQLTIMAYEMARSLAHEHRTHRDRLSAKLVELLDRGWDVSAADYDRARSAAELTRSRISELFADVDVLLAPAAPGEAPRGIEATGDPAFNRAWTLLGLPCLTLPVGRGPNGLPVGLQVIGKPGGDAQMLGCALQLERWMGLEARSA